MSLSANGRDGYPSESLRRCAGFREEEGEPCRAHPMKGSEYCFQHDPELEAEREALFAGQGRRAGSPVFAEEVSLKSAADVQALLERMALYLATGERIEPRRITALTGVVDRLLRTIAVSKLEAELAEARAEIGELRERCAELERVLEQGSERPERRETPCEAETLEEPAESRPADPIVH